MEIGMETIPMLIAESENRAFQMALNQGYVSMGVSRIWDIYYTNSFAERPMSTLGPGVPIPKTLEECWALDPREDPVAMYTVIIRDLDTKSDTPSAATQNP
jgi:hypothetical protein